jgi:transposase
MPIVATEPDFRRIATRYDKLSRNFASSVSLAAVIIWWAD